MVAASCMVLYGYDASVYNSVQGSKNWDNWFDHPVEACVFPAILYVYEDSQLIVA
jgi:hypothetical protein